MYTMYFELIDPHTPPSNSHRDLPIHFPLDLISIYNYCNFCYCHYSIIFLSLVTVKGFMDVRPSIGTCSTYQCPSPTLSPKKSDSQSTPSIAPQLHAMPWEPLPTWHAGSFIGLALYTSCGVNLSWWELVGALAISCPENSISPILWFLHSFRSSFVLTLFFSLCLEWGQVNTDNGSMAEYLP